MIEENRKEQQTKVCGKCGRELPLERFSDNVNVNIKMYKKWKIKMYNYSTHSSL